MNLLWSVNSFSLVDPCRLSAWDFLVSTTIDFKYYKTIFIIPSLIVQLFWHFYKS
jgi:hypothetical protein